MANINMKPLALLAITIIFCCLLMLGIAGCNTSSKKDPNLAMQQVYSGTTGLGMSFIKNLPPTKLYDTSSLDIIAELENLGAYDLNQNNCVLHLHGFDPNTFIGLEKTKYCGNMKGKSMEYPLGERNTVEFRTDTINMMEGLDVLPQKFVLSACYDYQTVATPVVCIDPTYYDINAMKGACTVGDVSMGNGQGAPVAVSSVGVNMIGKDRVNFEINIKNVGGGQVLRNGIDLFSTCPINVDYQDYDIVDYDVVMKGATKIRCSPELEGGARVRLMNGVAKIICTYSITEDGAYTTPLNVWLGYSYSDSVSKSIEVLKTP